MISTLLITMSMFFNGGARVFLVPASRIMFGVPFPQQISDSSEALQPLVSQDLKTQKRCDDKNRFLSWCGAPSLMAPAAVGPHNPHSITTARFISLFLVVCQISLMRHCVRILSDALSSTDVVDMFHCHFVCRNVHYNDRRRLQNSDDNGWWRESEAADMGHGRTGALQDNHIDVRTDLLANYWCHARLFM